MEKCSWKSIETADYCRRLLEGSKMEPATPAVDMDQVADFLAELMDTPTYH